MNLSWQRCCVSNTNGWCCKTSDCARAAASASLGVFVEVVSSSLWTSSSSLFSLLLFLSSLAASFLLSSSAHCPTVGQREGGRVQHSCTHSHSPPFPLPPSDAGAPLSALLALVTVVSHITTNKLQLLWSIHFLVVEVGVRFFLLPRGVRGLGGALGVSGDGGCCRLCVS